MHQYHREIPSPLQTLWDILDEHGATTPSLVRLILRAGGFVIVTAALIGPYALAGLIGPSVKRPIAKLWFEVCRHLCGLTVTVTGTPSAGPSTLYVANHVSYLDILVLGAVCDARFVAKGDVAGWPLFGLLAKMADTVFVTRNPRRAAADADGLRRLLAGGARLILFPEGTSSNGRTVLPFRTSMFAAAEPADGGAAPTVQPVSIAYAVYADGRPLRGALTDLYSWYGEMTLFGHLMTVFGLRGASVEVTFAPPLDRAALPGRKALAQAAETEVRAGLKAALARRRSVV